MISSVAKIIDKIGEIFTVFDFSYIVSGVATFSVICYGLWQNDLLGSLGSTVNSQSMKKRDKNIAGLTCYLQLNGKQTKRPPHLFHCRKERSTLRPLFSN